MSKAEKNYHPTEERWHSISHLAAALLGVVATVLMLFKSVDLGPLAVLAVSVFGLSLVLLYTSSGIYHASTDVRIKARWRKFDHAAIYLLIAGSYTPFTFISMRDSWGFWLGAVIWAVALIGITLEFVAHLKFKKLSLALYLMMGWLAIVAINPLLQHVPTHGLWWLLAGGLCYSFGVIFYLWHRLKYHHLIWHLWVVAGSFCHFIAIYGYVLAPVPL